MTKFRSLLAASAGLALALAGQPAAAESLVSLQSDVKVERIVTTEGKENHVLAAPTDVVPGDKLLFSTSYANDSSEAIDNFVVTNPLPKAVKLATDDSSFEVSVDGGKSYAALAALSLADGQGGKRPAALEDVTHIRWIIAKLAPGQKGQLSYHAIVR